MPVLIPLLLAALPAWGQAGLETPPEVEAVLASGRADAVQALLSAQADPCEVPGYSSAAHAVANHGLDSLVGWLDDRGCALDRRNEAGWQPLHTALSNAKVDVVEALFAHGVRPGLGWQGMGLVHHAALSKDVSTVRWVLDELGEAPDEPISRHRAWPQFVGTTPLMLAAELGAVDVMRLLLERGADPMARRDGTPLYGPGLEQRGRVGDQTALFRAATSGQLEAIDVLLDAGVDVDTPHAVAPLEPRISRLPPDPVTGVTGLHVAAMTGQLEAVEHLVERGADLRAVTGVEREVHGDVRVVDPGHTVLTFAAMYGHAEVVRRLLEWRRVDRDATVVLTQWARRGAGIPDAPVPGHHALHVAAAFGHVEVIEVLLEAGFDPEAPTGVERTSDTLLGPITSHDPGDTALVLAARFGHADAVAALAAGGALLLPRGDFGSPMYEAILNRHTDTVVALLDAGHLPSEHDRDAAEARPEILRLLDARADGWFAALGAGAEPAPSAAVPLPGPPTSDVEQVPQVPLASESSWQLDHSGRWLLVSGRKTLQVWDMETGLLHRQLPWETPDRVSAHRRALVDRRGTGVLIAESEGFRDADAETYLLRRVDMVTGAELVRAEVAVDVSLGSQGVQLGHAGEGGEGWWLVEPRGERRWWTDELKLRSEPIPARLRRVGPGLTLGERRDLPLDVLEVWNLQHSPDGALGLFGPTTRDDEPVRAGMDTNLVGERLWWTPAPDTDLAFERMDLDGFGDNHLVEGPTLLRGVGTDEPHGPPLGVFQPRVGRIEVIDLQTGTREVTETAAAVYAGTATVPLRLHPQTDALFTVASTGVSRQLGVVIDLGTGENAMGPVPDGWHMEWSVWSGDGRWMVARAEDGLARIDTTTGATTVFRARGAEPPGTCTLDARGRLSCVGRYEEGLTIDLATGRTLPPPGEAGAEGLPAPHREAAGRTLRIEGVDGIVHVEEGGAEGCAWRQTAVPFPVDVRGASLSEDGRFVLMSGDAAVVLVDAASCELASTLLVDADREWALALPDGSTMTSARGAPLFGYRLGSRTVPFEAYDMVVNRPGRVLARLGYAEAEAVAVAEEAWSRRVARAGAVLADEPTDLPRVGITRIEERDDGATLRLHLEARDEGGLARLHLHVNGVPVFGRQGRALSGARSWSDTVDLPLADGDNRLRVVVEDAAGHRSLPDVRTRPYRRPGTSPTVHFVGIGVSDYARDDLDLQSAAKDVRDVAEALGATYKFHEVRELMVTDAAATREGLAEVDAFLAEATVDDIVIVYLAGHGLLDDEARFWFGLHDVDPDDPAARGLAFETVEGWLDPVTARRRLVFLDACNAGDVYDSRVAERLPPGTTARSTRLRPPDHIDGQDAREVRLRERFADLSDGSGAVVISASGAYDFALDGSENGTFTTAVLEALRGERVDTHLNHRLTVRELQAYVEDRVVDLTNGMQRPVTRADNLELDFELR